MSAPDAPTPPIHIIEASIQLDIARKQDNVAIDSYSVVLSYLNSSIHVSISLLILSELASTRLPSLALALRVPSRASKPLTATTRVSLCVATSSIPSHHQTICIAPSARCGSPFRKSLASLRERNCSLCHTPGGDSLAFITADNHRIRVIGAKEITKLRLGIVEFSAGMVHGYQALEFVLGLHQVSKLPNRLEVIFGMRKFDVPIFN
jgi:hypothetical protein